MLQCHYTRARIPALINQELPQHTRRYVARHLDQCAACRAEFERQKAIKQELIRELPRFGKPNASALDRIWLQVQADLSPVPPSKPTRLPMKSYSFGGILAGLLLVLLLPIAGSGNTMHVPNHPAPQTIILTTTPTNRAAVTEPTVIALVVQTAPVKTDLPTILDNTPATPSAALP